MTKPKRKKRESIFTPEQQKINLEWEKQRKKKNQTDATLRNVRAANKKLESHTKSISTLYSIAHTQAWLMTTLLDILKSKRLLTPAQVKMLEDCLK